MSEINILFSTTLKTSFRKKSITAISIFLVFSIFVSVACGEKSAETSSSNPASITEAELLKISLSEISDGKAHFYQYAHKGQNIRFFILKSSDGIFRAAFDACDVCWRAGKGYYQQGDYMVCRNCGRKFASTMVNEVEGGCNPAPLNRKVNNETLEIKTADIIGGAGYFNL